MPPKKKLKSVVTEAIDDLVKEYEHDDDSDLNACKVSLGKSRNIKHWKKINHTFAEEYDIDPETLNRRTLHFYSLIPVENVEQISQEWKDCFIQEIEKFLTVNFDEWRIWPDDQITQVFEDYVQKKTRDDSIYRYMFRRMNTSFITKAIVSYTKLSSRKPQCLFYLLKYMSTITPNVYKIFDIINFIYSRKDITSEERTEFKKAFIFQIFPSILDKIIKKKKTKEWRVPFFYTLRMLIEINYENHDPEKRVLNMVVHLFRKICEYRSYPRISTEFDDLKTLFSDLQDYQKGKQFTSPTINDDASIKSDETETDSLHEPTNDNIFTALECECLVFHYIFLYILAWQSFIDPGSAICFLVENMNACDYITNNKAQDKNGIPQVKAETFNVSQNVQPNFDSFKLMIECKQFLTSNFPGVFEKFFTTTKMDQKYYYKHMDMNFALVNGNYNRIVELLKDLFSHTKQFPVHCMIDLSIAQISFLIRISSFNDALNILLPFANQIPKLFFDEDNSDIAVKKDYHDFGKQQSSAGEKGRTIEVRTMDMDNVVDVVINFLMIILTKQIFDKKIHDIAIEKILILSQHNWPQYSPLVDECFKVFNANNCAVIPSFRDNIIQSHLIEELSGLKHRCPNIKFFLTPDKKELSGPLVQQLLLEQIERSVNELPAMFFLTFILNSYQK